VAEAQKRGDLLCVLRLGNRHADIGKNEDWHEKFLTNNLKALEAEKESVKEELLVCEGLMLDKANLSEKARADFAAKIAELKTQLEALDRRRDLYLKESSKGSEMSPFAPGKGGFSALFRGAKDDKMPETLFHRTFR
jgi:hypothetical protein